MNTLFATGTRRLGALSAVLAAGLLLSACASTPKTPEEQVSVRAKQRWDALIKRDFNTAYTYAQPAYRELVKPESYKARFGTAFVWKEAEVHSAKCEPELCTVKIKLVVTTPIPTSTKTMDITSYLDEVWIRDQGQWWFNEKL